MGTVPSARSCPVAWSAAWPLVGRQCEGLQQELSEQISFPKPALGCVGKGCVQMALVLPWSSPSVKSSVWEGGSKDTCGRLLAPVKGGSCMHREALPGQKHCWKGACCCAGGVSRCL